MKWNSDGKHVSLRKALSVLFALMFYCAANAQTVTGEVVDAFDGFGLPGVSIW